MKGIVFCEFLEMVDSTISPEMTEKLIDQCDLPSGGNYTNVGTYEHGEIISLVSALSHETGTPVPVLVKSFGLYLLPRFAKSYSSFFDDCPTLFDFLESIDAKIHVEVRKLYREAELPRIQCRRTNENVLKLVYESGRAMGDLAEGLIEAAISHFGENISMTREDLSSGTGQRVLFTLKKQSEKG